MSLITAFNKLLLSTIHSLVKKFPKDKDIFFAYSQVELSMRMSPFLTVETFMESIDPYRNQIETKDENFFIHMANTDDTLQCFELSDKWKFLDTTERDALFANVLKLIKLGDTLS